MEPGGSAGQVRQLCRFLRMEGAYYLRACVRGIQPSISMHWRPLACVQAGASRQMDLEGEAHFCADSVRNELAAEVFERTDSSNGQWNPS